MSSLPAGVVGELRARYRLEVAAATPLSGYDVWADSWRVDSDRGPLVLRADRCVSSETAGWLCDVQRRAERAGVPCCPPLPARDRTVAFRAGGATVTVREFAEGAELDRDDPAQVTAAGATLALLHRAGESTALERPTCSPWHADRWPSEHDPPALHDPELDAWYHGFSDGDRLARGVVHGDFYASNLVWSGGRVAAVIDWAEAHLDVLARELSWAIWEFGHDDCDQLDVDRARTFLGGYRRIRGPWESDLADVLIPLMRVELRRNVRYSLPNADADADEYSTGLQRAFAQLRRQSAAPLLDP